MIVLFLVIAAAVYVGVTAAANPQATAAKVLQVRYALKYTVLSLIAICAAFAIADKLALLVH